MCIYTRSSTQILKAALFVIAKSRSDQNVPQQMKWLNYGSPVSMEFYLAIKKEQIIDRHNLLDEFPRCYSE